MADGRNTGKKRDRIGLILLAMYELLLVASVILMLRIIGIQLFFNPDPKIERALTPQNTASAVEPARGNILDCEGRLLAMTCPTYEIGMDCTVMKENYARMSDRAKGAQLEKEWLGKARELSYELVKVFPGKTADQYYNAIREGRENGKKYLKLGVVDRNGYNQVCQMPLFREGRFKGGLSAKQDYVRQYPYGKLARRTIGFVRNNKSVVANKHVGLEGKFDYVLHGKEGREWLRVTDNGRVRNNDSTYTKAVDGKDLRITLNIDYQDIADRALRNEIEMEEDLEGATLVLMEVKTGAIRAMVNLVKDNTTGAFEEGQNLAVGRKGEPGSVFKTVTLMSVLSDGHIKSLDETIPTRHGIVENARIPQDRHIADYEREHHTDRISILDGFKMSSNYVFATLAIENYGKKPMNYIENVYSYKLGEAFDFDLDGLQTPTIPSPKTRYWTNADLGAMGYGYSTGETPLHILTFYNAIANKGRMMKPYLVEDIEEHGIVCDKRGPSVLNSAICSKAVADTLTRALMAVTEEGTAKRLKNARCDVAGKTGTSFGTYENGKYEDEYGRRKYQGTFVGFFPAEDPCYSVICTVYSKPTSKSFQGGGIPARAIKTIIDRLYCIDPHFQTRIQKSK